MKNISFDGGKTFISLLDDDNLPLIIQKMRSRKNWEKIVDILEADAMLSTIKDLKIKSDLTLANAESRIMFLATYLKYANEDIITKM